MGRTAKPTALKSVEGVRKSRINHAEPKPTPLEGPPAPPEWLSEGALGYWSRLADEMFRAGILTVVDPDGFAVLCSALDVHERATRELNESESLTIQGERGWVRHPALQTQRDASATIRSWCREFGLTPSARAGIHLNDPVEPDEAVRLLA